MQFEYGNIWDIWNVTDCLLVTTNGVVTKNGLVMGKGSAKEAVDRFPFLKEQFGEQAKNHLALASQLYEYRLLFCTVETTPKIKLIGALQTKYHYSQGASLRLMIESLNELKMIATFYHQKRFDTVFPGIGYGKLEDSIVLPYLLELPDNVHVWRPANARGAGSQ